MTRQPEGKLVVKIKVLLDERGAFFFKVHAGEESFQVFGLPDIICCYNGRFVGLEVKTDRGRLRPKQKLTLTRIRKAGGVAAVVRSVAEVEDILNAIEDKMI